MIAGVKHNVCNEVAMQNIEAHNDTPLTAPFAKSDNETYIKTKEAMTTNVEDDHTIFAYCPFVDHIVSDFRCQDDTSSTKNC